jgi:hypothetical protein
MIEELDIQQKPITRVTQAEIIDNGPGASRGGTR